MVRRLAFAATGLSLTLSVTLAGCARNPVTGRSEFSLVSESQEIEMGRSAAQDVATSIGYYDNSKVQAYVAGIGKKMAAASERPNLPWEFHVVDDASVNAFALPGGFIFITRGLMTHVNNEAELATVIGHEIGHVTAKHSVRQMSNAQLATLGLGIGSLVSEDLARVAGAASQGLGLLFLKFGRDAETQADDLGFKYALRDNYDVREMASVFQTLGRVGERAGGGKLPEWLATHPDPENRVARTRQRLDTLQQSLGNTVERREEYLKLIEGMTFGADPRQGYFDGNRFLHPDLRFQLTFPEGWQTQNTPQAVVAVSKEQDAIVQLSLAGKSTPEAAAQQFLSQQGVQAGQGSRSNINGFPAATSYFTAQTGQGSVQGIVSFISLGGTTYGLLGYSPAARFGTYDNVLQRTIKSFSELKDQSALNVKPARVELVKLTSAMTLAEFNARYPSTIPIEDLAIINEVEGANDAIPKGRTVKRVVGGR